MRQCFGPIISVLLDVIGTYAGLALMTIQELQPESTFQFGLQQQIGNENNIQNTFFLN